MVRDPHGDEEAPDVQDVFEALRDPDCREIVRTLEDPMTAEEISEQTGIPNSTTYRKLELLSEASLLDEGLEIRSDGQHATRYTVGFEKVIVALAENREFDVDIARRSQTADERLANIWSEVRQET